MSKGFVIEFSVDVADDGDEEPNVSRFRVLVRNENVRAFQWVDDVFGQWAEAKEDQPAPAFKGGADRGRMQIIAWAFEGFAKKLEGHWKGDVHTDDAPAIPWRGLDNGLTLIDIGTVKREA